LVLLKCREELAMEDARLLAQELQLARVEPHPTALLTVVNLNQLELEHQHILRAHGTQHVLVAPRAETATHPDWETIIQPAPDKSNKESASEPLVRSVAPGRRTLV
jgi:hypothetical protein